MTVGDEASVLLYWGLVKKFKKTHTHTHFWCLTDVHEGKIQTSFTVPVHAVSYLVIIIFLIFSCLLEN